MSKIVFSFTSFGIVGIEAELLEDDALKEEELATGIELMGAGATTGAVEAVTGAGDDEEEDDDV